VEWAVGPLGPGQGGVRTVTVGIDALATPGAPLAASAFIDDGTPLNANRSETATHVEVANPLTLTQEVNPNPARLGQIVPLMLTATNRGLVDLLGVEILLPVPEGVVATASGVAIGGACVDVVGGSSCNPRDRFRFTIGALEAGKGVTVSVPFVIDNAIGNGSTVTFDARMVDSAGYEVTARQSLRTAAAPQFDLAVREDQDPAPPDQLTYTATFGNRVGAAQHARLRLALPPGTTLLDASDGGSVVDGAVEWPIGALAAGQGGVRSATVSADPPLDAGEVLRAGAVIRDDPPESEKRAEAVTRVQGDSPLHLAVQLGVNPAHASQVVPITITATNVSGLDLLGVVVEARIPEGVNSLSNASIVGGSCIDSIGGSSCDPRDRARWTIGPIPTGSEASVSMMATVSGATVPGTVITLDATVLSADGSHADAGEALLVAP
jgi:hypothetical protein